MLPLVMCVAQFFGHCRPITTIYTALAKISTFHPFALILSLLNPCCPPHISRLVISIVIDAIKSQSRWTFTYVIQKRLKTIAPLFAHRNASTTIIRVSRIFWIKTPTFCGLPKVVFSEGGYGKVFFKRLTDSFTAITTATCGQSFSQRVSENNLCIPAGTETQPISTSIIDRSRCSFQHSQSTNSSSDHIYGRSSLFHGFKYKHCFTKILVSFWILLAVPAFAQNPDTPNIGLHRPEYIPGTWGEQFDQNWLIIDSMFPGGVSGSGAFRGLVANLPSAPTLGQLAVVTDAANVNTCSTGGGSTENLCQWTGSAWDVVSSGSGGGGSVGFGGITAGTNTGQSLIVGNGTTLSATGTGAINATSIPFTGVTGTATDAQIPNLNTLSTGLTASRCVRTDGSSILASSTGDCFDSATLQAGAALYCTAANVSDAYTCNVTPALSAYTPGMMLNFRATAAANTGTATLVVNGLSAITIVRGDGSALQDGDIAINVFYQLWYDGTNFRMPLITSGSFSGGVAFTADISPAQITSTQNDYAGCAVASNAVCRITTDTTRNITGFAAGADGRILFLYNVGSNNAVLKNLDSGSSAGNQLSINADINLGPNQGIILQYDSTSTKWRAASGISGGGAGQAADNDLTAIAALVGTGFSSRIATDSWALRSFADGTGITWTNPAGVAGNPTANLATTHNCIVNSATGQVLFNNGGTCDGVSTVLLDPSTGVITASGFIGPITGNVTSSGQSTFTGSLLVPSKTDPGSPITNEIWRSTTSPVSIKWYDGSAIRRAIMDSDFSGSGAGILNRTGPGAYSILNPVDDTVLIGNSTTWDSKTIPQCGDTGGQHLNYDQSSNGFSCGTSSGSGLASVTEDADSVNIAKAVEVGVITNNVSLVRGGSVSGSKVATLAINADYNVAGTTGSLTTGDLGKFDSSGRIVRAGPAFKLHQFIIGAENGAALVDGDDQPSIFYNHWGQGITIAEVWCETDTGTSNINLQRDDGSPANILSASLTCSTSGASSTSFSGTENQIASTQRVDFLMVTAAASGTPHRVTVSIKYTMD